MNQYTANNRVQNYQWLIQAIKDHGDSDECLLWPFTTICEGGYGQVVFEGRHTYSHRLSFYFANGHWPTPSALHHCDNKPCCNPNHIYEGTQKDNIADMVSRDRHSRGTRQRGAKLNDELVKKIRSEYRFNDPLHSLNAIANKYGTCLSIVSRIVNRKRWKHVP